VWNRESDQAIQAYKDFGIFFPMMEEAAYAQLQVAMTHYKQMEKPDRDRTHVRAAEEEFQVFLSKYPNDKLASKAEQHLREVQECWQRVTSALATTIS